MKLSTKQKTAIYNMRNGGYFRLTEAVLIGPVGLEMHDISDFVKANILNRVEINPNIYELTRKGKTINID